MKLEDLRYGRKVNIEGENDEFTLNCNPPYDPMAIPFHREDGSFFYAKLEELYPTSEDFVAYEAEFQKVFEAVHPLIQANLEEAARLINEAVALADKTGVPFRPAKKLTFINPSYVPQSFFDKFPEVAGDSDIWCDITGAHGRYYRGWQYSQTC